MWCTPPPPTPGTTPWRWSWSPAAQPGSTRRPNGSSRGGQAYAALPLGASNVACTQRLELLAPDGTSCGARDYQIAAGTCSTGDLTLGLDGTVIQQLPASMESERSWYDGSHTCTWRWW